MDIPKITVIKNNRQFDNCFLCHENDVSKLKIITFIPRISSNEVVLCHDCYNELKDVINQGVNDDAIN